MAPITAIPASSAATRRSSAILSAGRSATAPKATADSVEDDEAIHNGGIASGAYGITDDVDLEVSAAFAALGFPYGIAGGIRMNVVTGGSIDVGFAARAGIAAGTGGNAYDSASEFDGIIPQPVAYVRFASVYKSFRDIDAFMLEMSQLVRDRSKG